MCRSCGLVAALCLIMPSAVFAAADLDITKLFGAPLNSVASGEHLTLELRLVNRAIATNALSAYLFNFQEGSFATGMLHASNWRESTVFSGFTPAWMQVDQSLDTAANDFRVSGVSGSLALPYVGPALPLDTPVVIGVFDVTVTAQLGAVVDFVLVSQDPNKSGIDDQDGNLGGAGLSKFGVPGVQVTPEPTTFVFLFLAAFVFRTRKNNGVRRE